MVTVYFALRMEDAIRLRFWE